MWWLLWHQSECLEGCSGGLSVDTGPVRGSVVGEVSGTGEEMRVGTNSICKHTGPVRNREAEKSCVCLRGHPVVCLEMWPCVALG